MDLKLLDEISQDKVTVSWTDKSLGNVLKEYTKAFVNSQVDQDFHGLILLSQNNILNLIDHSNKGQKKIFTKAQWRELKNAYPVTAERLDVDHKVMDSLKKLSKAAGRYIDSGIDLARELYKKTTMTGDERNFYCFVHKFLEILERHPELFNDEEKKKLTENDYVVRLWAPMLFALFEDCRKLNLTWGESVLRGVGDDSYYKVDLRVTFRHEKQNYVLSTGEFSKSANLEKMRMDHVKLLLEGSMIIDNAKIHHVKPEISLLQCAGTEADILLMKAVDKKFTVANRSTQALHISSNLAPDKLISVYNCFLQYKRTTIDFMNLIVSAADDIHTNSFDQAWRSNTSSQESTK